MKSSNQAATVVKKISSNIVSTTVVKKEQLVGIEEPTKEIMSEEYARPDMLIGSTYKIKAPASAQAIYITINDVILNAGTIHEERRPFEIFINSKEMKNFQWIVGFTRVMSGVFRKGGDVTFLVDEMTQVFDPQGGYFIPGSQGVWVNSVVAHMGLKLKDHLTLIGMIKPQELDKHQQAYLEQKRADLLKPTSKQETPTDYSVNATVCSKCQTKAVVMSGGCEVCLECSHSRCN